MRNEADRAGALPGPRGASASTRRRALAHAGGSGSNSSTNPQPPDATWWRAFRPSARSEPSKIGASRALPFARPWIFALAVAVSAAALMAPAHTPTPDPYPAPAPQDLPASRATRTLRFAVVSFYNPRLMYLKYQPLVDYLSTQTPWRFQLDLSPTYQQTIDRLCGGQVDLAYLGPFSYVRAHEVCGARPVVRLNTAGRDSYTSYVMVRQDSRITNLAQLKGERFAFGSRLSASSHLVPRAMLDRAGLRPGVDVTCAYYGHHDRAARAVLLGEAAACGIRDLVGDQFKPRGLRVLAQSDPIPNFPLVVGPEAPSGLAAALTGVLIDLPARNKAAAATIAGWDPELAGGFAPVSPEAYLPVLRLARRLFGPRAPFLPAEDLVCRPGPRDSRPPTPR